MSVYLMPIYGFACDYGTCFACDYGTCSHSWEDADASGRRAAWARAREAGWRFSAGKHYCPAHAVGAS